MCEYAIDKFSCTSASLPDSAEVQQCVKMWFVKNHLQLNMFQTVKKLKKIVEKTVSKNCYMLKCCIGRYITQEMCKKVVSNNSFMLKYCPIDIYPKKCVKKIVSQH